MKTNIHTCPYNRSGSRVAVPQPLIILAVLFAATLLFPSAAYSFPTAETAEPAGTEAPQQSTTPGEPSEAAGSPDPAGPAGSPLARLLPEEEGYEWFYQGFAEYGQHMTLQEIAEEDGKRVYRLEGTISDPSGGRTEGDYDFSYRYLIEGDALVRELEEQSKLMDDRFPRLVLIRTPLEEGTEWTQEQESFDGEVYRLRSRIALVAEREGLTSYRVEYRDDERGYVAERVLREGDGVTRIEIPWEDYRIGYSVIRWGNPPGTEPFGSPRGSLGAEQEAQPEQQESAAE